MIQEEIDNEDNKIRVKKKSQNKDVSGWDDDKLSAVSMRLLSRKEKKQKEIQFIIEKGRDFIEEFENGKDFYKVDDIIVDLTKVINDVKKFGDIEYEKIKELEEMRKVFRYLSTAKNRADKAIKEIQKKRDEARAKFDFQQFENELEELRQKHQREIEQLSQKHGIPSDFDENIDQYVDDQEEMERLKEIEAEYASNAQKMEQEAKDTVRYIRELLTEYYEIPDKIIQQVSITIKAMGAVAKVSKKSSSAYIPVEVLKEIMKDPKIKELLDPYVEEKDFADQVRMIGAKFPNWGHYFGEAEDKLDAVIDEFESTEKEVEQEQDKAKSKENVNEGVVRDAVMKSINIIHDSIKQLFNKTKSVIKSLKNKVYREGSNIESDIESFKSKQDQKIKDMQKAYLDVEQMISQATLSSIKEHVSKR